MFDHQKLIVYQKSVDFAAWTYQTVRSLRGDDRHIKDQILRSSQSVPLNIAEGNGCMTRADRKKYFRIARSSALESSAAIDVILACGRITEEGALIGMEKLLPIVKILSKMSDVGKGNPLARE